MVPWSTYLLPAQCVRLCSTGIRMPTTTAGQQHSRTAPHSWCTIARGSTDTMAPPSNIRGVEGPTLDRQHHRAVAPRPDGGRFLPYTHTLSSFPACTIFPWCLSHVGHSSLSVRLGRWTLACTTSMLSLHDRRVHEIVSPDGIWTLVWFPVVPPAVVGTEPWTWPCVLVTDVLDPS